MAKTKNKKKTLPLIIITAAVVIAAVIFVNIRKASVSVDVYPASMLLETNWDNNTLSGEVSEGRIQNIALKEGIVDEVCVSEGQSVKAGDVLMKYDTESFRLTIKSDEAKIASIESAINKSKQELEKYKGLIPSEYAPVVEPTIIHHTAEPVDTISEINSDTAPSEQGEVNVYYCTSETVVKGDFLQALHENSLTAALQIYENNVLYGTWTIDGSTLGDDESVSFDDWTIGEGVSFNGDGTANIDFSSPHYGTLETVVPAEAEWDEVIEPDVPQSDGENYVYSKDELAKIIREKTKEIEEQDLTLREAKLTYEKDKLTYDSGEVKASIDGVVTDLKNISDLGTGADVMKIKGTEKAVVVVAVSEMDLEKVKIGDQVDIMGYESGTSAVGMIKEIDTEPLTTYGSYGTENPNNSYYLAKAYVDDENADFKTGENCQVTLQNTDDTGGKYLPIMYIRSDTGGKYVMADDDGKLVKKYIKTGKSLWGYVLEIKGGIDEDDKIAFPYGKNVKEGVQTKDAELEYNY